MTRRADLLGLRFRRHQLHVEPGSLPRAGAVDLLDVGVQDTGADGALWALANRGAPAPGADELVYAWTLRGAPHAYRRADIADIVTATAPFSEADAAKRIFDASKPFKDAGIPVLEALQEVAAELRTIVTKPTIKGDASGRLSNVLDEPYLRFCRACNATHIYEQPFRLAALQAGLELQEGTSPPVLRRVPELRPARFASAGDASNPRFDVIRCHLRFFPGAGPVHVAAYLDAPRRAVEAHWPDDAVEIAKGSWVLAQDEDAIGPGPDLDGVVRLLGSHDPFLQLRDRNLLVADESRHKALWPTLGRPGAVVADGALLATWRPRSSGSRFTLRLQSWGKMTKKHRVAIGVEAERLAAHRGASLAAIVEE